MKDKYSLSACVALQFDGIILAQEFYCVKPGLGW